ncbi:hypothetical protein [Pectobacterium sp. CHL-2024]|uniref:hypothetical protein n=1 Tax=Pectobacterium sp. CHL-2024 TaxID=3377079 RepID=UPI0038212357
MIDEKSISLAVALNKETVRKNITWHVDDAPANLTFGSNNILQVIYWADYKNKRIVIYNHQYRHYLDDVEWTWGDGIVLCIVTNDFKPIWKNEEQSQALRDLYASVTKQAAGFHDLLGDLLNP